MSWAKPLQAIRPGGRRRGGGGWDSRGGVDGLGLSLVGELGTAGCEYVLAGVAVLEVRQCWTTNPQSSNPTSCHTNRRTHPAGQTPFRPSPRAPALPPGVRPADVQPGGGPPHREGEGGARGGAPARGEAGTHGRVHARTCSTWLRVGGTDCAGSAAPPPRPRRQAKGLRRPNFRAARQPPPQTVRH